VAGNDNKVLYSWGGGIFGETGTGEFADVSSPKVVKLN
jgi:hypothetical protein